MNKDYKLHIKKFFMLLLCLLIISQTPLTIYSSTNTKDTITIGPDIGEYRDLKDALANVKDGGTIYIKPLPSGYYYFNNTEIDKNVTIEGLESSDNSFPGITWRNNDIPGEEAEPLITVNSPYSLQIKNLVFRSNADKIIIQSNTSNLSLENVKFAHSRPLIINNPTDNSKLNININNCDFVVFPIEIRLEEGACGNISLTNNKIRNRPIIISNSGAVIQLSDNEFIDSGLIIENVGSGSINIVNNIFKKQFIGISTKLFIQASPELNISHNKFTADNIIIKNTSYECPLDLGHNWWSSDEGPLDSNVTFYDEGEIDYSNWSLDEDFSSFEGELPQYYGSITGTALLQNSLCHKDIEVALLSNSEIIDNTYTDSSGYFEFSDKEYGLYSLCFNYDNFDTVTEEVYLSTGNASVDTILHYNINHIDLDDDGNITESDLVQLLNAYGLDIDSQLWNKRLDLNYDGIIDIFDMIILSRFREEF